MTSNPDAFTYPAATPHRRHAPSGYSDYESYRPWLRDEFCFRCVYCLLRERWGRVSGEFDLDHFIPQACDESLSTDYGNLIYSCHACNTKKGSAALPNAELYLTADSVFVLSAPYAWPIFRAALPSPPVTAPLTGITAAVVGVILNLALFFAWHVLWPQASDAAPFAGDFEWFSLLITIGAFIGLWRYKLGIIPVIGMSAVAGLAWHFVG